MLKSTKPPPLDSPHWEARAVLLPCQAMFGVERGDEIIALIEAATGELCPCKQDAGCPLVRAVSGREAQREAS